MGRKKELLDKFSEALRNFDINVSTATARLEAVSSKDDQQKIAQLGVNETVLGYKSAAEEWHKQLHIWLEKKVHLFPADEAGVESTMRDIEAKSAEAKGCVKIVDQVRNDRKAEEKRLKSAVDYMVKKDVRKHVAMGVPRKIGTALVRVESESTEGLSPVVVSPISEWHPWKASLHTMNDVKASAPGLAELVDACIPLAIEKTASLQSKMRLKDLLAEGGGGGMGL